ncbi:MAG TPA: Fe-S cluster domain-containing protein [Candidatus Alistipes faecavium]|nr:Fe-S cluster domain-containing protein [Candidatus Alistipes faecavium]
MQVLLFTILTLCALGILSAVILYFVARKFRVEEDPRIDEVEKMLPGANCGGCGFAGCRGMADALVKRDDISDLFCPVGGGDCMKAIASYLGKAAAEKQPEVATVRCGGTCAKRPRTNAYNGAKSCAVAASLYVGETGCAYGCLGYGDCVAACAFDAIRMNPETGLPEVDPDKCTACGACVKACPKKVIELRKKWPKNRAVYVSCVSKDKGAVVMKACKAGCIGCGKCVKVCAFGAITVENNLAYIDPQKCKLCRKCVNECPTGAIRLVGMDPLPKEPKAPAAPAAPKTAPAAPKAAPAAEKPAAEKKEAPKAAEKPAAPKAPKAAPAAEKPAAEKKEAPKAAPAVEKPAAEKKEAPKAAAKPAAPKAPKAKATPAAEKPAAEKPAAEKPTAEKPAVEKPAAAKPSKES